MHELFLPDGIDVQQAAARLVAEVERTNQSVIAKLGDIEVSACPGDAPQDIVDDYHKRTQNS